MSTIHIKQRGFLINTGKKVIRTPLIINCDEELEKLIMSQIAEFNIITYEISRTPIKNTKPIKHNSPAPKSKPKKEIVKEETKIIEKEVKRVEPYLTEKYILNYKKDNVDERDHIPLKLNHEEILQETTNPSIIDYTEEMSPVKNQGSLGSCVGFAVVAMKEWQEQQEHLKELAEGKKYKRRPKNYDLSEQWLYYKCKEIDCWPNEEGTSIRFAMTTLNKIGVPCEKAWPYNTKTTGKPKRWARLVARWSLGGEYTRLLTPEDIIKSLRNNGPVPIGVGVFYEMFYPNNGMIKYPSDPNTCYGGHAICLVGWNPESKLFKFKNSWGDDWGQEGYGYLSYAYIRDFCWDAWEIKDLRVTKEMLKG